MNRNQYIAHPWAALAGLRKPLSLVALLLVFAACTDDRLSILSHNGTAPDADGIAFGINVLEQADLIYDYGRTRAAEGEAAPDSATCEANSFLSHPLQGGESWNLRVHRMPLPIMGIHPHTVNCPSTPADTSFASVNGAGEAAVPPVAATRASLEDIVGSDIRTFHDSMTVWGYTYIPTYKPTTGEAGYDSKRSGECYQRVLYDQILVKKIRGWRNSVHWPYDLDFYKTADLDPALNPNKMRFYAYAPSLENMDITLKNTPGCTTEPVIQFTVPDNPAEQRDLLYGRSAEIDVQTGPMPGSGGSGAGHYEGSGTEKEEHLGDDDKTVPLTFRHILTAVRFAQGNMPVGCTVKKIQLHGIPNQGTYDPAASSGAGAWSAQTGSKTYVVNTNYTVTTHVGAANAYIDGGNVLLLLPGTMTATQTMEITLNDGSRDHTLTCSLADDSWQPGYTVTYKITVGEVQGDYYLLLDAGTTPVDVPAEGATGTETKYKQDSHSHEQTDLTRSGSFTIHSYRNYKDYSTNPAGVNRHHAVKWQLVGFAQADESTYQTATYTLDKDAVPGSWITSFDGWNRSGETASEQTGGDSKSIKYEMETQSYSYQNNHATTLYNNNIGGKSYVDLSSYRLIGNGTPEKVPQTTANCYIVNSAGTYSFPAVYGNGIEGGTEKSGTSLNPSGIFLDHEGRPIQEAYIIKQVNHLESEAWDGNKKVRTYVSYNNSEGDLSAELLWIDNNHSTVTSPSISGSGGDYSVQFTVQAYEDGGQHYLPPCNAVIALKGKRTTYKTSQIYKADGITPEGTESNKTVVSTSDSPEILWTWHIWVTDEVLSNNNTNTDDTKYPSYYGTSRIVSLEDFSGTKRNILPVNLGWVPDSMAWGIYKPREVWVKIKQVPAESDQVIYLKLRLEAQQDKVTGTSTMYQWGRPTALPMVKTMADATRTVYDKSGTDITASFEVVTPTSGNNTTNHIPEAIKNPTKMIHESADHWWNDGNNHLYWNTAKTLYDPCPPGFQVPTIAVFTGMTTGASLSTTESDALNMWLTPTREYGDKKGGYFYAIKHTAPVTDSERYGSKYYFPSTGYYSGNVNSGALSGQYKDRSVGTVWTTDHSYSDVAGIIYFNTSSGKVKSGEEQNVDAHAIRPVSTTTSP